jgi:hypothetical protein
VADLGVKMLAICINNYFVEKVEAPVVFFSVYGFLWSFVIQYKLEKSSCSLLRRVFNQMWVLKYCKDLLDRFNSRFFYLENCICPKIDCYSQNVSHIYKQLLCWKSRSTCSILFCIWILVKFCYSISTRKVIIL